MTTNRIIIVGFSGTGKSRVGVAVSQILGWEFLDTDQEIVQRTGKSIAEIFRDCGEETFRNLEREEIRAACTRNHLVISTGGGAMMDPANREIMEMDNTGFIVCLEARPNIIYNRLLNETESNGERPVRPLLEGPDPLQRIQALKEPRQSAYALSHWTVHTDNLSVNEVTHEIIQGWRRHSDKESKGNPFAGESELAAVVETNSVICPLLVGWGLIPRLGELLQRASIFGTIYIISDSGVYMPHMRTAQRSLQAHGIQAHIFVFPQGEHSKSLDMAARLYQWLAERRARRGDVLLSVGGGVAGDLTGFVAATYNRGMRFVQVPTSLAAMVDASIGGKTAVDLPDAKNLVGAFHQPKLVIADIAALQSLPRREAMGGWAEAIKHGLILDKNLFDAFEDQSIKLLNLEPDCTMDMIRRSMAIKAKVVSQDEHETTGYRTILNYGHTIGHALEVATDYERFIHGEAVSIGMMGAALIGKYMGITPPEVVERQERVLSKFNLPLSCSGIDHDRIEAAMALDKKVDGESLQWILLQNIGQTVVRGDVPKALVQKVLLEIAS